MKLVKVESSNVEAVGYENSILYVKYPGGLYAYEHVPMITFIDLINADSIGQFVNKNIKNNFMCSKIG